MRRPQLYQPDRLCARSRSADATRSWYQPVAVPARQRGGPAVRVHLRTGVWIVYVAVISWLTGPPRPPGRSTTFPGEPGEIAQLSGVEAVTGAGLAARASIRLLMPFLCSAGGDGVGVLMGRFGCRPEFVRGCGQHLDQVGDQGAAACYGRTLRI